MSIRRAQDERIEGTPDGISAISEIMDVPDAPTIGTATDNGGLGASVTFTASVKGGTPSTYTVTSTPGSITGTGSSSPVTVSGLTANTAYTFKVKAANAAGTFGPESSASNSVTPLVSTFTYSYDVLATTTLSSAASSITFANIPTEYTHLQIRAFARGTSTGNSDYREALRLRVNGDSANNYTLHRLWGDGAAVTVAGVASRSEFENAGMVQDGDGLANAYGIAIIDILDYNSSVKYKTLKSFTGFDNNETGVSQKQGGVLLNSCLWAASIPITSVTLYCSANLAANSTVSIYGVK
jgi:hypothetical protein